MNEIMKHLWRVICELSSWIWLWKCSCWLTRLLSFDLGRFSFFGFHCSLLRVWTASKKTVPWSAFYYWFAHISEILRKILRWQLTIWAGLRGMKGHEDQRLARVHMIIDHGFMSDSSRSIDQSIRWLLGLYYIELDCTKNIHFSSNRVNSFGLK